jgi:tRNA modification GTPase
LQTPPGRGGIAVIMLRGDGCAEALAQVFRPLRSHAAGGADVLQLGRLVDGAETIDEAIVCRRGDTCEINIHGGPAVARRTMQVLAARGAAILPAAATASESLPLAHPRWDNPAIGEELLTALAEAQSDLVVAAVAQQWSAGLSELAGRALEAIDSGKPGAALASDLRRAAAGLATMQRLLNPPEAVLAGPVNVGKSTLANALIGRQVAIVHETPGTTRDWVREMGILCGVPVWLTDTAGLWEAPEGVDAEAIRRARQRIEQADLVLLTSAERPTSPPGWLRAGKVLNVWTKADLAPPPAGFRGPAVCAMTGEGLDELKRAVLSALGLANIDPTRPMAFTPRQADLLTRAADAFDSRDSAAAREYLETLLRHQD